MRRLIFVLLALISINVSALARAIDPRAVVVHFYRWHAHHERDIDMALRQQKWCFDSSLYDQLMRAYRLKPSDGEFLDYDPFLNSQAYTYFGSAGKARISGRDARVLVTVIDKAPHSPQIDKRALVVVLRRGSSGWQIANFIYPGDPGKRSIDLMSELRALNRTRPAR